MTAIQLGISGLFFPARNAIFPDVISREQLSAANALSSSTWSTMLALGTALGGFVAGSFGVYTAFAIDALSFFVSALLIAQLRYMPSALPSDSKDLRAALREYGDGFRYFGRYRDILVIVLQKAAVTFCFAAAYEVTAVSISQHVFVIGEGGGIGLGFIYAIVGVGTGLGPIIMRAYIGDRDRALRIGIFVAYLIAAAGMVLAASMVNTGFSFALFSLASAVAAGSAGWALEQPAIGYQGIVWILPGLTLIAALLWGSWVLQQGWQQNL